jgi:hypothetical protein
MAHLWENTMLFSCSTPSHDINVKFVYVLTVRVGNITWGLLCYWDTLQDCTSVLLHSKGSPISTRKNSDPILRSTYDNTAGNNTCMPAHTACFHSALYRRHTDCSASPVNSVKSSGYFMLNVKKSYVLPTVYLRVSCGYENKQRLLPCTALTGWFL